MNRPSAGGHPLDRHTGDLGGVAGPVCRHSQHAGPTFLGFPWSLRGFGLTCGTVGVIVTSRRPENLNGWLFCAIGVLFGIEAFINEYVIAGALVCSLRAAADDGPWLDPGVAPGSCR